MEMPGKKWGYGYQISTSSKNCRKENSRTRRIKWIFLKNLWNIGKLDDSVYNFNISSSVKYGYLSKFYFEPFQVFQVWERGSLRVYFYNIYFIRAMFPQIIIFLALINRHYSKLTVEVIVSRRLFSSFHLCNKIAYWYMNGNLGLASMLHLICQ